MLIFMLIAESTIQLNINFELNINFNISEIIRSLKKIVDY